MFYIYILHSETYDRYYVGQTNNIERRLEEHNTQEKNSYTSKFRPWAFCKSFEVGESLGIARKIENYIKRQKSRVYIEKILERGNIDELIDRFAGG